MGYGPMAPQPPWTLVRSGEPGVWRAGLAPGLGGPAPVRGIPFKVPALRAVALLP
jgi:hypothetical protein